MEQGTSGGTESTQYLSILVEPDFTEGARSVAHDAGNRDVAAEAERLLLALRNKIDELGRVSNMPPMMATAGDDQSLLIEWIFPAFRVGFGIEPRLQDSSWVLVSTQNAGRLAISGPLYGVRQDRLLNWILEFVKLYASQQS